MGRTYFFKTVMLLMFFNFNIENVKRLRFKMFSQKNKKIWKLKENEVFVPELILDFLYRGWVNAHHKVSMWDLQLPNGRNIWKFKIGDCLNKLHISSIWILFEWKYYCFFDSEPKCSELYLHSTVCLHYLASVHSRDKHNMTVVCCSLTINRN